MNARTFSAALLFLLVAASDSFSGSQQRCPQYTEGYCYAYEEFSMDLFGEGQHQCYRLTFSAPQWLHGWISHRTLGKVNENDVVFPHMKIKESHLLCVSCATNEKSGMCELILAECQDGSCWPDKYGDSLMEEDGPNYCESAVMDGGCYEGDWPSWPWWVPPGHDKRKVDFIEFINVFSN